MLASRRILNGYCISFKKRVLNVGIKDFWCSNVFSNQFVMSIRLVHCDHELNKKNITSVSDYTDHYSSVLRILHHNLGNHCNHPFYSLSVFCILSHTMSWELGHFNSRNITFFCILSHTDIIFLCSVYYHKGVFWYPNSVYNSVNT